MAWPARRRKSRARRSSPALVARTGSFRGTLGDVAVFIKPVIVPGDPAVTGGVVAVYAVTVENLSLSEINHRVSELRLEHRNLDAEIDRLAADIRADELSLKRLKKRKLWLKDCISRLESALIPDEPA